MAKKKKSLFDSFLEGLETDPPVDLKDSYAHYGFYYAHYVRGDITLSELKKLRAKLGLSNDEVDGLTI